MDLEREIEDFLRTDSSIFYSQGFSTIPCMISAFAKRGEIQVLVAGRGINFAIQKVLRISRSAVRWFIIMTSRVLKSSKKNVGNDAGLLRDDSLSPEGFFEKDGAVVDCQNSKVVRCQREYGRVLIPLIDRSPSTSIASFLMRLLWHGGPNRTRPYRAI